VAVEAAEAVTTQVQMALVAQAVAVMVDYLHQQVHQQLQTQAAEAAALEVSVVVLAEMAVQVL
jgi:hypothetical protein